MDATRTARLILFFRVEERTTVFFFFFKISLTCKSDSLVSDGRCKQHTAPRASFDCHIGIFLMCTWLKFWSPALDRIVGLQFLRVLKVIPSHSCFTAPCLTHSWRQASLHRFLHLHLVRLPLLRCYILRCVHPMPPCKEGHALADWLNDPLSQVMTQVSHRSQQRTHSDYLNFEKKKAVSTRTLTISRPLWMRPKSTTQQTWDG